MHVRGDVLLSRRLVGIRTYRVLPIGSDSTAMPARKLLLPSVSIVYGDHEPTLYRGGDLRHIALRDQGSFDSLSGFGINAVTVEKLHSFGRCGVPGFKQSSIFLRDAQLALRREHVNRERVKEFVGKNDDGDFKG